MSDRLPGPAVLGSGREPTCLQALDSLTVPGAGLKPPGPGTADPCLGGGNVTVIERVAANIYKTQGQAVL